jgi:hypothetical protein
MLMQPREESVRGCVATVQFSRAVREGVRVIGAMERPGELRRSLKTQQHAAPLELDGMPSWQDQVRSTFQADRAWHLAWGRRRRRSPARERAFPIGFR